MESILSRGGAGLRFFVGLSSVAAIQGNPGQANYAAANRMMSALLRYLRRKNGAIRFKALMLPPVEGAGMADDPEVREMLKRKGVAYIHVNELAGLFCRELFGPGRRRLGDVYEETAGREDSTAQ